MSTTQTLYTVIYRPSSTAPSDPVAATVAALSESPIRIRRVAPWVRRPRMHRPNLAGRLRRSLVPCRSQRTCRPADHSATADYRGQHSNSKKAPVVQRDLTSVELAAGRRPRVAFSPTPLRMTLQEDIVRAWRSTHYGAPLRWSQRGGGRTILYMDSKHPIEVLEEISGNTILILAGNKPETAPCIMMDLYPATGLAVLNDIDRRDGHCFRDNNPVGRDIVLAAFTIAYRRGMRRIELTDKSYKECPDKIPLSNLSFMTRGATWYETILPNLTCVNCHFLEDYRRLARQNTWRRASATISHPAIDELIRAHRIDVDAEGSAMAVLSAMKDSRQFCVFLATYLDTIMLNSGIPSLHGRHWVSELSEEMATPMKISSKRRKTRKRTIVSVSKNQ